MDAPTYVVHNLQKHGSCLFIAMDHSLTLVTVVHSCDYHSVASPVSPGAALITTSATTAAAQALVAIAALALALQQETAGVTAAPFAAVAVPLRPAQQKGRP